MQIEKHLCVTEIISYSEKQNDLLSLLIYDLKTNRIILIILIDFFK
jgi:hypothetical protein